MERQGIIKIFSIFRVDRKSQHIAHITAFGNFAFLNRRIYFLSIGFHFYRKIVRKSVFCQNRMNFGIVLPWFSKDFDYSSKRTVCFFRPIFNMNQHNITVFCITNFLFWDKNISIHFRIGCRYKCKVFLYVDNSNKIGLFSFDYLDNFAFWLFASSSVININLHFVSIQRFV
ncbi:hypothetical protein D9M72_477780 [compost metagenome]